MNQKHEITRYVAQKLELDYNEKHFKNLIQTWWQNPRTKSKGGLRLTKQGFEALRKAEIKNYEIHLEEFPEKIDNKFLLWLDNFVSCPFFITPKKIYLFDQRMAVQLVLFSGNIYKLYRSQVRFTEKQLD